MKIIGVIPARYASTRLEGKVLADIGGKPMVQHVYEAALQSHLLEKVIVAVDDQRCVRCSNCFWGRSRNDRSRLSLGHRSGCCRS